jgi:hypothetical protein
MAKVNIEVSLPDGMLQDFLQHLRDFDTQHDPLRQSLIHIAIGIEAANMTASEIEHIFKRIRPPFENQWVFPGTGKT